MRPLPSSPRAIGAWPCPSMWRPLKSPLASMRLTCIGAPERLLANGASVRYSPSNGASMALRFGKSRAVQSLATVLEGNARKRPARPGRKAARHRGACRLRKPLGCIPYARLQAASFACHLVRWRAYPRSRAGGPPASLRTIERLQVNARSEDRGATRRPCSVAL